MFSLKMSLNGFIQNIYIAEWTSLLFPVKKDPPFIRIFMNLPNNKRSTFLFLYGELHNF